MERPLGEADLTEPEFPSGFTHRIFAPGVDDQAWVAPQRRCLRRASRAGPADPVGPPRADGRAVVRRRRVLPRRGRHRRGAGPIAFHWTKVPRDGSGKGEVYVVGVHPAYQGRGWPARSPASGHTTWRASVCAPWSSTSTAPTVRLWRPTGVRASPAPPSTSCMPRRHRTSDQGPDACNTGDHVQPARHRDTSRRDDRGDRSSRRGRSRRDRPRDLARQRLRRPDASGPRC